MKAKGESASKSTRYRAFIRNRDLMLEAMNIKAHQRTNDVMRGALASIVEHIVFRYTMAPPHSMLVDPTQFMRLIESDIQREFLIASREVAAILARLKIHAYSLALVGEAEAIGRAEDRAALYQVHRKDVEENALYDYRGRPITSMIDYAFDKLRRKIASAVQLSRINDDSTADMVERVRRAMPSTRKVIRPAKVLKALKEARVSVGGQEMTMFNLAPRREEAINLAQGFIDDDLWDEIIQDYLAEYSPKWKDSGVIVRDPTGELTKYSKPLTDSEEWYEWEVEQVLTHEFVSQVRQGQVDAAKQNGITDFQWIAILDDKTDECCAWRDGLTSKQIEAKMGQHDDECDAVVPPAHFNCRCSVAPMLEDMTDEPSKELTEFEEWLNS
jgi:SPP1 gp7 family putative phage head morphogenesis protein